MHQSTQSTNPRTNPSKFHEKILRIGGAGKWGFYEAASLNFLSRPFWFFFASSQWKKQPVYMRYNFYLHFGWFFQNLGKEVVRTFMHTTVSCKWIGTPFPSIYYELTIKLAIRYHHVLYHRIWYVVAQRFKNNFEIAFDFLYSNVKFYTFNHYRKKGKIRKFKVWKKGTQFQKHFGSILSMIWVPTARPGCSLAVNVDMCFLWSQFILQFHNFY